MPHRGADWLRTAALIALALVGACGQPGKAPSEAAAAPRTEIGLLTSLPLFWPEAEDPADLLSAESAVPWPRAVVEQRHTLVPLDTLEGPKGLSRVRAAVLAQPRPLSPGENVTLDAWVRAGGHVLVFADPALTAESRFALGDRRRPMDTAFLSPILTRWGLVLTMDEAAQSEARVVNDRMAGELPLHLSGTLGLVSQPGVAAGVCRIESAGVVARCRIGRGSATVIADAALFDEADETRETALMRLIDSLAVDAAGTARESTGGGPQEAGNDRQSGPPKHDEGV